MMFTVSHDLFAQGASISADTATKNTENCAGTGSEGYCEDDTDPYPDPDDCDQCPPTITQNCSVSIGEAPGNPKVSDLNQSMSITVNVNFTPGKEITPSCSECGRSASTTDHIISNRAVYWQITGPGPAKNGSHHSTGNSQVVIAGYTPTAPGKYQVVFTASAECDHGDVIGDSITVPFIVRGLVLTIPDQMLYEEMYVGSVTYYDAPAKTSTITLSCNSRIACLPESFSLQGGGSETFSVLPREVSVADNDAVCTASASSGLSTTAYSTIYNVKFLDSVSECWVKGGYYDDADSNLNLEKTYDSGSLRWTLEKLDGSDATIDEYSGKVTFGDGWGLYFVTAASKEFPDATGSMLLAVVELISIDSIDGDIVPIGEPIG